MKVSIITINYNNKEGLEKTIQSVISQTYNDYEYIIIDGGSTDGSVDIIKQNEKGIDYWISEKDTGIYNAMNKGIQRAKGEYLHFLNSGDCYYSNDVLDFFFRNKTYAEGIIRGTVALNKENKEEYFNNHSSEKITFYQLYYHTIHHQATFINKSLFDRYGLYEEQYKISSDWLFFAKAILNGEDTIFVDKIVVLFDVTGISTVNHELTNDEKKIVMSTLLPSVIIEDYKELRRVKLENFEFQTNPLICFLFAHKFPRFVLRCLRKIYSLFGL